MRAYRLLLWNYSSQPAHVELMIEGAPSDLQVDRMALDARSMKNPAFAPLYPQAPLHLAAGNMRARLDLESYGMMYWSLNKR